MLQVSVFVSQLSGERLWGVDKQLPPQIQIAVNVNLLGLEQKPNAIVEAPFVFTVNFTPPIAQITVKGMAHVSGDKEEIDKILEEHKQQKPPPISIVQAVSNTAMAEAILISKTIGIPPPLPPLPMPSDQFPKKTETKYTV